MTENKNARFAQREKRVRARVRGTQDRPRLAVFRSNKYTSAQLVNDDKGVTMVMVSTKSLKKAKESKTALATVAGEQLAKDALKKKIKKIVFDRRGYKYHGRIAALAEGARKGGLEF